MKACQAVCMTVANKTKQGLNPGTCFTLALQPVGANSRHSSWGEWGAAFFPKETEKLSKTIGDKPELRIFGSPTADNEHVCQLRGLCLSIMQFTGWCRQRLNGEVWLFKFMFSLLSILHNVTVKLVTVLCRYVPEMLPALTKRLISPSSLHQFSWEKLLTYLLFFQVDFILPYIEISWDINKGYLYTI